MQRNRTQPTEDDVLGYLHALDNNGRWGADDELGTLNLITDDKRLAAIALAREGVVINCATLIGPHHPAPDVPYPPLHFMLRSGESRRAARPGAVEFIGLVFHSHIVTHIDALSHTIWDDRIYGRPADVVTSDRGATFASVDAMRNGVITRGVLLDIAGLRGLSWMQAGDPIFPEDLEEAERTHGVQVGEGDALLVRTGWWERRIAHGPPDNPLNRPGLHAACLPWLHARGVSLVAADAANDVVPSGYDTIDQPIHEIGAVAIGLPLIDVCRFDDLAEACRSRGRWEFLFVVAPLRLQHATGSPVTPLAMF